MNNTTTDQNRLLLHENIMKISQKFRITKIMNNKNYSEYFYKS